MLAEHYNVETLEVFGSFVRDEQKKDSDLDILVTFKEDEQLTLLRLKITCLIYWGSRWIW